MFKFQISTGAAALAAIGMLCSCASNEPLQETDEKAEVAQTRYITISLSSPVDATRAFDQGTAHESEVKRLDFFFYDRSGNRTGNIQSFTGDDLTGGAGNPNFTEGPFESGNVTRIWTAVVPVELAQGDNLPSQVICLVNANPAALSNLGKLPLEGVEGSGENEGSLISQIRDYVTFDNAFMMTNSVYYGTSQLTGQPNVRICATPINKGQLYSTVEEATNAIKKDDAENAAMVNIYVERLAAKVGLTMAADAVQAVELNDGDNGAGKVTLTFVPEYWFMNAVAKNAYVTKRYGIPAALGTDGVTLDPTYTEINNNFNTYGNEKMNNGKWNDPTNHRSYWAMSPSYAANNFPMVSDQIIDMEAGTDNTKNYAQKYYSYNEVKTWVKGQTPAGAATLTSETAQAIAYNNGFAITNTGDHTSGYIYTRETTTAISRIRDVNKNPAATVASAVIVGHYYAGETAPQGEYTTFCIDHSTDTYYGSRPNAISALMARNEFIYTDNAGTTLATTGLVLAHPVAATRAKLPNPNIAGRLVTLQIEKVPGAEDTPMYYYNGTRYVQIIDAETLSAANAQLAQGVGYLDMYYNGRAFFSMPIRHLGWENNMLVDGKYEWASMDVGSLGLVRNHVYTINVTGIKGLGTGLRSDDQPIVPPVETLKQYIAMRLNILSWNVANTWNVEL